MVGIYRWVNPSGHSQSTHKGLHTATAGEKGEEFDIVFREAPQEEEGEGGVFVKVPRKSGKKKKGKGKTKGGKKKREILFRTKVRKRLLKEYHSLVSKRKKINKAIRDNRRHRNQLVFHRK